MEITSVFKEKVIDALLERRALFGGSDTQFARSIEINPAVFNRIKNGERDRVLADSKWLSLGREFGVSLNARKWNTVETDVFAQIREEILWCKAFSKSRIFVDNCGIGKTYTAKYLAKKEKNVFYIDCTQCRKKSFFIKALARVLGVEVKGQLDEIKENTKYYISLLEQPIVIVDEAGALDKDALGLVQEYWNATEGFCGWYMMGANALRNKIATGVSKDRDYFAELFSRFSDNFSNIVPVGQDDKVAFYKKLIADVLGANINDKTKLNELVNLCIVKKDGVVSGLRRAESLLLLHGA